MIGIYRYKYNTHILYTYIPIFIVCAFISIASNCLMFLIQAWFKLEPWQWLTAVEAPSQGSWHFLESHHFDLGIITVCVATGRMPPPRQPPPGGNDGFMRGSLSDHGG